MAKASSVKSRPSLLYIEVQINGKNALCLVDTKARHSFMNSKLLAIELDLPTKRVGKFINMWIAKEKVHKMKDVAFHVTLKSRELKFVESFTLCEMDKVDLILVDTFFKAFIVEVTQKLVHLVVCHESKEVTLKLIRIPMVEECKLILVLMDQMKNVILQLVVVIQMGQNKGIERC